MLAARGAMLVLLWNSLTNESPQNILYAFYVGAKFDMRIATLGLIPLGLFLLLSPLERVLPTLRRLITLFYGVLFFFLTLAYVADFGWFFYLRQRLDASAFEFLANTAISLKMIWESYPVVPILVASCAITALFLWRFNAILQKHHFTPPLGWKKRTAWSLATFLLGFLMVYGQLSVNLFPLRWSNAYFSVNRNLVLLALNPVQNLRDTLHTIDEVPPDKQAVQAAWPRIAPWLGANPDSSLNPLRIFPSNPERRNERLNIVVIIMESLSLPKTSFAPNNTRIPADPTPNLTALAKNAAYFSHFFAPTRPTARAVFTTITGIPDVNRSGGTSARNPFLTDQFLLMNEFAGYEKYYMIGGSANWANIRSVFSSNIEGLHLVEEGQWKSPIVDVWGISDLDLFRESVEKLDASAKPFVAVIQTAAFHKPYTIPKDRAGFEMQPLPPEIKRNYGFTGEDEYNAMRFCDHALGEFFRIAKEKPWFDKTIFAVFGDHGLNDPPENMPLGYRACRLESNHTPMLLIAPEQVKKGLFASGVYDFPCGQPDVFPTLAILAGIPFRYTGMGRNLFDPHTQETAKQYIAGEEESFLHLVQDGYCYTLESDSEGLYRIDDPEGKNLLDSEPERALSMHTFASDYFHIAKFLLYTNKKQSLDYLK